MSKIIKKVLVVVLALLLAIPSLPVVDVEASVKKPKLLNENTTMTYYTGEKDFDNQSSLLFRGNQKNISTIKISKVKSSNNKVLRAKRVKGIKNPAGRVDYDWVELTARKAGTVTVTFEAKVNGNKTYKYKAKIKIVKYQNPFKSLEIGSKNYASMFKRFEQTMWAQDGQDVLNGKLNIVPAKGWKISKIELRKGSYTNKYKKIKNGTKINLDGRKESTWGGLSITMRHTKTGIIRHTLILRG